MSFGNDLPRLTGTGSVSNAGATTAIIAAQGAGVVINVQRGCVSVTLAATGTGGLIRICDGTTTIMQWDANAVKDYYFDFGDVGYSLTANTAFNLIASAAVTNQASATCAAVGYKA